MVELTYQDGTKAAAVYKSFRLERNIAGEYVLQASESTCECSDCTQKTNQTCKILDDEKGLKIV